MIAGVVVSAAVADGVPEEAGGDPAAGAAAPARLRARRPARHALPRRPLQAQEGGQGRHQGRTSPRRFVCYAFSISNNVSIHSIHQFKWPPLGFGCAVQTAIQPQ